MTRRESARRIIAARDDFPDYPLKTWHIVVASLIAVLVFFAIVAPGAVSDLSRLELLDWRGYILVRITIILLSGLALFVVRGNRPIFTAALLASMTGLSLRMGVGQTFEEPLTLGLACLMFALGLIPISIMVRPNSSDKLFTLEKKHSVCEENEILLRNDLQKSDNENRRLRNLLTRHGIDPK